MKQKDVNFFSGLPSSGVKKGSRAGNQIFKLLPRATEDKLMKPNEIQRLKSRLKKAMRYIHKINKQKKPMEVFNDSPIPEPTPTKGMNQQFDQTMSLSPKTLAKPSQEAVSDVDESRNSQMSQDDDDEVI